MVSDLGTGAEEQGSGIQGGGYIWGTKTDWRAYLHTP